MTLYAGWIKTFLGEISLVSSEFGIQQISFQNFDFLVNILNESQDEPVLLGQSKQLFEAQRQLNQYFHKQRKVFDLCLDIKGTDFQQSVFKSLLEIPYGQRISYKEQAQMMNRASSVRAVANASGKNKLLIVVPCHRVILRGGGLGGFTAGINLKSQLLDFEQ